MFDLFKKRKNLTIIIDNISYVRANCYMHQLLETLEKNFKVNIIEFEKLPQKNNIKNLELVFVCLRLRSYAASIEKLKDFLGNTPVIIYEQDPWESFTDQGHYQGTYFKIAENLNIKRLLTTSSWWAEHITSVGLPGAFVRMGTLPRYCKLEKKWEERTVELGFQGGLHPYRKKLFDELAKRGHTVEILPYTDYFNYMKLMQNVRIFVCSEEANFTINGKPVPYSISWAKSIEVAAQGAFFVRDHEPHGYIGYGIKELPSILTFKDFNEAAEQIAKIKSYSPEERERITAQTVARIRARDDWNMVCEEIKPFLN